jgi:hypothetical protein
MTSVNDLLTSSLKMNYDMFKMTLADMTDAELMTRPVAGANHGNWQIGHLIGAEIALIGGSGAKMPELPVGFKERYTKETSKSDDASKFATKAELLAIYDKVRAASIEFAKSVTPAQLAAKGPVEFTPTAGDAIQMQMVHVGMHWGQIQVLRRKLGKPILF